ncbi:gliding motility-associated lipoprotein GldD [Saonia flava]|uniref:Gliding motility-associated lipoprotein GldD n=1 Tax=Saonia flava TaxID=523696 RepID=A0A846QW80_9FLAO|nr:gliding motility lipoprotein GldD [Saonia flava]NJB71190.1 gliding motility-associated lipoprotein GldD [Saonia flava]
MHNKLFYIVILILVFVGCKDDNVLPKPKAMLRLDYSVEPTKRLKSSNCHYNFEYNQMARIEAGDNCSMSLDYPMMKGSIFITYKKVEGNINSLLADAQKLSYEHAIKADNIINQPFVNEDDRVYGMFYEVKGNAASQAQFYVTDSTDHFVTGSLYFYAKPNYDSIYPAAIYLQKDIRRIMESLRWEE